MRQRFVREVAFLLWRAATKLDAAYMLAVARTLTRLAATRDATIQIEVARQLAQRLDDWSEPVQIKFVQTTTTWEMHVRSVEQTFQQVVAERAARQ